MGIDISRLGKDARAQVLAKLAVDQVRDAAKKTKYHNQPDTRGEIRFDSRKEAQRYDELMLLLKAGKIRDLKLQPQFTLQESFVTPDGERVRAIRYVADFSYERQGKPASCNVAGVTVWSKVVEDVKSSATRTAQYKIKRKMFREKYGFDITEV